MRRHLASAVVVALASSLVLASPQVARAGSSVGDFEIDGNLVDSSAAGIDWSTPPPSLVNFTDPSGNKDDSFNTGSKELEPGAWDCQTGSAPQKGDITSGQVAFRNLGGKQFVYVDYTRKSASGDAHIDYEFNQLSTANPVCPALPLRKDGDIAVTFDTENGGASIIVRAFRWAFTSPGIGTFTELPTGSKGVTFDGAVNIPNTIPSHTAGDFGEAALNLSDTIGAFSCGQFASLHMNSRSSTAINSALQDRTVTKPLPLPNCPKSALDKSVRNITKGGETGAFADTATASPGDVLEYKLHYTNTGDAPATNVVITDTVQTQYQTFKSCSPTPCGTPPNLSWTFSSVAAGGSQDVTFRVTLASVFPSGSTHVKNVGAVDTAQEDPKPSDETDVTVTAAANLSSAKTVSPTSQDVGKSVTYTVKVTNSGGANGTTTVVDDYDENHLTISNISNGGVDSAGKITWTNLSVPAGQTVTLTYDALVKGTYSGGPGTKCTTGQYPVVNNVTITGGTGSNATLCVNANPVITSDKTVSPGTAPVGGSVTYTVKVTNSGSADAVTTVTDDYDENHLTISNISNSGSNSAGKITWTNLSVPAGQTITLTYTGTVKGTFSGPSGTDGCSVGQYPVFNNVTVTGGTGDSATLCVIAAPSITSTKTISSATAKVGDTVTYTIKVINSGAAAATTTVTDDYDQAHLTVSNISNGGVASDPADKITWTALAVPANTTVTLTYDALVKGTFSGSQEGCSPGQYPVLNSVTLTVGSGSNAKLCVTASPVISSDKTVNPTTAIVGQTVDYKVVVSNTGDADGTTTVVDDYDQAHLTISNISNGGVDNGDTITWTNLPVAAKSSVTLTYQGTVKGTFSGSQTGCQPGQYPVVNNVTVTGGTGDTNTLCVTASAVITTTKTVNRNNVEPGDVVTYTITVTNSGDADGVTTVTDDYDQLHLDISNISNGGVDNGNTIVWSNVTVPAKSQVTRTYNAQVHGPFGPPPASSCDPGFFPVLNLVTVTGGTGADATLCVNTGTTLAVSKTSCPTVAVPGGLLTYTITYSNTGANPATNVIITDTVPTGTSVANSNGGTLSNGKVIWNVGTLAPGGIGSRTLVVLVNAANGQQLQNVVSAKADNAAEAFNGSGLTTGVSYGNANTKGRAWAVDAELLGSTLLGLDEVAPAQSSAPTGTAVGHNEAVPDIAVPGLVLVDLLDQTSTSSVTNQAVTTATSEVGHVDLLSGAIVADAVTGVSQSVAGPFGASANSNGTEIVNLRVNGNLITDITPGKKITVKNPLLPTQNVAELVVLEESKTAAPAGGYFTSTHSINTIRVTLLRPFLTLAKGAEIIVAHAESDATYPSGYACGTSASTVGANAFSAFVNGKVLGSQFVEVQSGDASITPLGGSDSDGTASVLLSPAATSGTATNTASGAILANPVADGRSRVEGANILDGLITASVLDVAAHSTANGTSAVTTFSTTFVNLTIGGTPIDVPVEPNTTLIELLPGTGEIVVIVLNEQITNTDGTKNTSGTVNAIHAWVLKDSGVVDAEVIVASAHSEAHK
jgi:uncharacterized repeat protein (TIGR01451 family)